jgi:hypothetical protein
LAVGLALAFAAGMTFGATSSPTGKRKNQLTINFQVKRAQATMTGGVLEPHWTMVPSMLIGMLAIGYT